MDIIKAFNVTVLGESHKSSGKPCQDSSVIYEDSINNLFINVVSDGHGGDTYFRSDKGSKFITEITVKKIKQFIERTNIKLSNIPFTPVPARTTELKVKNNNQRTFAIIDNAFGLLFSSIISEWNEQITIDWKENPPSRKEMENSNVSESYINKFLENKEIEKAYGCTLISFTQTSQYWFAFQIGDGKCVILNNDGKWEEPIPWDENCVGNITTSLCDSKPIDSFRYCYSGKDFPTSVFLSSDGVDDSYNGNLTDLTLLYNLIIREFVDDGFDKTIEDIKSYLPGLSEKGSRDDMSLAGIINYKNAIKIYPLLIAQEKQNVIEKLTSINSAIEKKETISLLKQRNVGELSKKLEIIKRDISKSEISLEKVNKNIFDFFSEKTKIQNKITHLKSDFEDLKLKLEQETKVYEQDKIKIEKLASEKKRIIEKIESLVADFSKFKDENEM